jgi:ubiquinone/menaquinone biosynthesis C-methylase UbiE
MNSFVNPLDVMAHVGVTAGQIVANLGCGSGFFATAAAKLVKDPGKVYAVDVQQSKLEATLSAARHFGYKNIAVVKADLDKPLDAIAPSSCDLVVVGSVLHEVSAKEILLQNAYRILKTGGKILIVEWKKEHTPFGPSLDVRIDQDMCAKLLNTLGFRKERDIPADSFHYAMLFVK